ncbi:hypothetical protein XENOCAPTIV_005851, partial [Xenoophorus captivus]
GNNMFNLDMNISKPVIFIIASSEKAYGMSHLSKEVTVYVSSAFKFLYMCFLVVVPGC